MSEREHSLQEVVNLHERGGLTTDHWQDIYDRLFAEDKYLYVYTRYGRIALYAQAVIRGLLPDTNLNHRSFLGRRHWAIVANLPTTNQHRLPMIVRLAPSRILPKNPRMLENTDFAKKEYDSCFTLDDYIYDNLEDRQSETYKLTDSGVWEIDIGEYEDELTYTWEHDTGHWFKYPDKIIKVRKPKFVRCDDQRFYERWLLTDEELPSHGKEYSNKLVAGRLAKRVREVATLKPDEVRRRLKAKTPELAHLHDSPHFGIMENPIPQGA